MADKYIGDLTKTTPLLTDYLVGVNGADAYQTLVSDVAKKIVEDYAGSTIGGSAQSIASAFASLVAPNNTAGANSRYGWTALTSGQDLNTVITPGIYHTLSVSVVGSLLNTPQTTTVFRLIVEYIENSSNYILQIMELGVGAGADDIYRRISTNGGQTWGEWYRMPSQGMGQFNNFAGADARAGWIAIPSETDMNTLTELGVYYVASDAIAATLVNCPIGTIFKMWVVSGANSSTWRMQILIQGSRATANKIFIRAWTGGNFNNWREITGSSFILTDFDELCTQNRRFAFNNNTPNAPGSSTVGGIGWDNYYNASYQVRFAVLLGNTDNNLYIRRYINGAWKPWHKYEAVALE